MSNKKFVKPNQDYIPEGDSSLLQKGIEELGLSEYTLAKLKGVEINQIIDLCRCQMKHLYKVPGMSKKNIFEVLKKLQNVGLDFKRSQVLATTIEEEDGNTENKSQIKDKKENKKIEDKDNKKNSKQQNNERLNDKNQKFDKKNNKDKKNVAQENMQKNNKVEQQKNNREQQPQKKEVVAEPKRMKVNSYDLDAFINDTPVQPKKTLKQERDEKIAKAIKDLPPLKNADGLYKFYRHGKWGYKTEAGKVVIEPTYSEAFNFREGLACVELNERCGFINKQGEIVIPIQYDTACSFSEGLASVTKGDKCGYIDKEGNVVFDFIYEAATSFENDIALVKKEGKWGYMDRHTGEIRLR